MLALGLGEYLILSTILGCVVGWFWQSKGFRFFEGLAWTLVPSVLFAFAVGRGYVWEPPLVAVFAFVVGALRRPNLKAKDEYLLADGQMKTCPFCAEVIRGEAVVCRYCGKDLASTHQSSSGAASQIPQAGRQ